MTLEELAAGLTEETGVTFVELAWQNAPATGDYGVVSFIEENMSPCSSNRKRVRQSKVSVDLYVRSGAAKALQAQAEAYFAANRLPWVLSDQLYERNMVHYDWTVNVEDKAWLSPSR